MQEVPFDFKFPSKGIDVDSGNESQPIGTSADCLNTRAFESLTARNRGGSREFLTRYIDDHLPGKIQHINFITTVDGTAFLGAFDGFPPYISSSSLGGATNWAPDPSSQFNVNGLERNNEGWAPIGGTGVNLGKKKKRPVRIVWSPPDGRDGQALDVTFLNAVAVDARDGTFLNGTMEYNPTFGYILRSTNKSSTRAKLRVLWTPGFFIDDEYDPKRKIVTITVRKRAPDIIWNNPSSIPSGQALSSTQLNATAQDPVTHAAVPGTFSYSPVSGTVLADGTHHLTTTFTPTNTTTYDTATDTVTINVGGLIAFVQGKIPDISGYHPTFQSSFSTDSNVTSGNLLVMMIGSLTQFVSSVPAPVTDLSMTLTITDTRGNTWIQAGSYINIYKDDPAERFLANLYKYEHCSLWYCINASTGANTITIQHSNYYTGVSAAFAEYSGVSISSPLRDAVTNSVAGAYSGPATVSTGTVSSAATDLVIATLFNGTTDVFSSITPSEMSVRLINPLGDITITFADCLNSTGTINTTFTYGFDRACVSLFGAAFRKA